MEVIRIDGTALPAPDSMDYKEADLQSEGYRDGAGYLHKTTVRWGVRTIKAKWSRHLTGAELNAIRTAVKGKEYVTMNYYSDTAGENGTMTAYTGDMDYKLARAEANINGKWKELSLSFIEQ